MRGHRHRANPDDVRSWSASSAHHLNPQRTTLPGVHPGPSWTCLARGPDSTLTKLPRDASTRCWSGPGLEVSFLGQDPAMVNRLVCPAMDGWPDTKRIICP